MFWQHVKTCCVCDGGGQLGFFFNCDNIKINVLFSLFQVSFLTSVFASTHASTFASKASLTVTTDEGVQSNSKSIPIVVLTAASHDADYKHCFGSDGLYQIRIGF